MDKSLKLRKSAALDYIVDLAEQLSLDDNLPYNLFDKVSIYDAMTSSESDDITDIDDNSAKEVYIGI